MPQNPLNNIAAVRKYLKENILNTAGYVEADNERRQVQDLVEKTICDGESNSVLVIGPRGSGKTTLVNNVLDDLSLHLRKDAVLVKLHGLIHTDDRLALKGITQQMGLENASDGKVFGSFSDNLAFLLACLKSGTKDTSKSVIFILEEFDLFCTHHNQTLLYNLFDISQSTQTPVCVLGVTCRLDVIELLEKRVKSRFSHRQIFLFLGREDDEISPLERRIQRLEEFLNVKNCPEISTSFRNEWSSNLKRLLNNHEFKTLMDHLLMLDLSERTLKNILIMIISQLDAEKTLLTYEMFQEQIQNYEKDDIVQVLQDLNVLELCLVIAMKHHCEIYDNQALNFEMIFTRYTKFTNSHSNIQAVPRAVIMKAFEHLENLELIAPVSSGGGSIQKEYQLFNFLVLPQQITEAVKKMTGLPTEVEQWANSSPI